MDFNKALELVEVVTRQQQQVSDEAKKIAKAKLLAARKIKPGDDIEPVDPKDPRKGWKKITAGAVAAATRLVGNNPRLK